MVFYYDGIKCTLLRASDDAELPNQRPSGFKRVFHSQSIIARNGTIFYPRIEIPSDFDWLNSNILDIKVKFADHKAFGTGFVYPWVMKPDHPQDLTVDLKQCHLWENGWHLASTRFYAEEVPSNIKQISQRLFLILTFCLRKDILLLMIV